MSLAFLFKKTWHPSTLQNAERVWIAEQKDATEKRRIEELTKRVREEQQVRELEEMQAAGGHAPERKERIDWMYEGPMQSAQDNEAEAHEYLLGKEFKMKDKGMNDLKKLEEAKAPGTLFTAAPATSANEAFRRVQEDPLLRMRKAKIEAEQSVMSNPVKMSKIRHQLETELAAKAERKRAKKEAKKTKKAAEKAKKREKKARAITHDDCEEGHNDAPNQRAYISRDEGAVGSRRDGVDQHQRYKRVPDTSGQDSRDHRRYTPTRSDWDTRRRDDSPGMRDGHRHERKRYGGNERSYREGYGRAAGRQGENHGRDSRDGSPGERRHGTKADGGVKIRSDRRERASDETNRMDRRDHSEGRDRGKAGDRELRGRERGANRRRERGANRRRERGANRRRERGEGMCGDGLRDSERDRRPRERGREKGTERPVHGRDTSGREATSMVDRKRLRSRSNSSGSSSSGGSGSRSSSSSTSQSHRSRSPTPVATNGGKRYGLLGAPSNPPGGRNRGRGGGDQFLGPAAGLLEAKEKERSEQERAKADARRRRVISHEEKLQRLKEMEEDGTRNQELKKRRIEHGKRADVCAELDDHKRKANKTRTGKGETSEDGSVAFIDKMRGEQINSMGLEERMRRNRHYQQRGADVHNFMERG